MYLYNVYVYAHTHIFVYYLRNWIMQWQKNHWEAPSPAVGDLESAVGLKGMSNVLV